MKKMKETTLGNRRYRIVRCKNCGKVFNAYQNGVRGNGILYGCISTECYQLPTGHLESVSVEEFTRFMEKEVENDEKLKGIFQRFLEKEGLKKVEIIPS